ncbi:SRPBCC family protein [Knoellia sp. Soil729]|uniref:SRPBCC family protein n=1 Tax=Knoellia sp. Soil729 TaxID=1736394 RepID=UPI0006FB23E6|nr:SRPBCC family protein [Knoellia sp. Soil729]KRE42609.1 polyketide cyclase [Knoellia sp. Soil729]
MRFLPPPVTVGLHVATSPDVVWDLLTDVDQWPLWGPTVSGATVDGVTLDGRRRIGPGATGTVRTSLGPSLPFRIEVWQDTGEVRRWSWRVAGLPATSHTVRARQGDCRVEMTAPWFAPAYTPVLWLGLRRIRGLAQARAAAAGTTD